MNELSLFSGAGGGLLASHLLGWRTIGYVENNDYCQRVIAQRIEDGHLPGAPIFGDIRAFIDCGYADRYTGMVDVVSAGFPCQPFSSAGLKLGADDPRNMWPQTAAVLRVVRPRFVFLENVPGLLAGSHGYFGHVLGELAEMGFDARWCVLGASDVGAPHLRKRLWVLGTAQGTTSDAVRHKLREQRQRDGEQRGESRATQFRGYGPAGHVADSDQQRLKRKPGRTQGQRSPENQPSPGGEDPDTDGQRQQICAQLDGEAQQIATDRDPLRGHSHGLRDEIPNPDRVNDDRAGHGAGHALGIEWSPPGVHGCDVSHPTGLGQSDLQGSEAGSKEPGRGSAPGGSWWDSEPEVGRVAHGVASRVDRLKAIGNGQVPAVAAAAWRLLSETKD